MNNQNHFVPFMPQNTVPGTNCNHWENIKLNCVRLVSFAELSMLHLHRNCQPWPSLKSLPDTGMRWNINIPAEQRAMWVSAREKDKMWNYWRRAALLRFISPQVFWIRLNWQTHRVIAFGSAAFCLSSCLSVNTNHFISCSSSSAPPLITSASSRLVCLPQPFQRGCISCCSGCLHSPSICFFNAAFVSFSATHMCVNLLSPCLFPSEPTTNNAQPPCNVNTAGEN